MSAALRDTLVAAPYPAVDDNPLDNVVIAHASLRGFLDSITPARMQNDEMTVRATDLFYLLQPALNRLCVAQAQLLACANPQPAA
jgi:hypothetical protein